MPTISMFYGIIIQMLSFDNKEHNTPHIHIRYAEYRASINIETGECLAGNLPSKQMKLVQAWVEIHRDELITDWALAIEGSEIFKIDPLK